MNLLSRFTLFVFVLVSLSSCILFNGESRIVDPCIEVREVYPNVGEDSCRWVRNVMRNHQPPNFLPNVTDTGGRLLAARILSDTGDVFFVSGFLPSLGIFSDDCVGSGKGVETQDLFIIEGEYCARPPVDPNGYEMRFYLNKDLAIFHDPQSRSRRFTFRVASGTSRTQYMLRRPSNISLIGVRNDTLARSLSGQFVATLHNTLDTTDVLELDSGRFDVTY